MYRVTFVAVLEYMWPIDHRPKIPDYPETSDDYSVSHSL